ncbi:lipoprotein-releasing system permease protein [Enhydrobacter aerosaccus]|uniref:Lipoprotein-releasing system permease protein n=1 Tax=Enhydrobacter aerosaccus TaxID=225324 RepID=A0A1T4KXZ8_9HYPH|nr:ABC transporter permease [Enhydrobacter aerosaccus]SJZ47230.1 lipoprotein-releasing system permease protein [Enhydrobacter aerosaccus]
MNSGTVLERNGAVERWLAWRYLATRQREGFVSFIAIFSLIGVALGVGTLIVVLSVMGGFREQLIGRLIGMNGHIVITARDGMLEATSDLVATLRQMPDVKAVHLTLERQALVTFNGQTRAAVLRGVRTEDLLSRDIIAKNIVRGELGAFGTRPGVVIGERLRQALNVDIGDKITLVTHRLNEAGTIAPRYADYEVLASFLTRRYEFDSAFVFVPLSMLQEDLEYGLRTVSSIDIELPDPAAAPAVAAAIRKALHRDDLKVADWQSLNARFVGALQVERVMMFVILSLIVLVAAMNVVASFTMLVRVKRGSIAILRTMGAGQGTIVRAFFMAAAGVGVIGTVVGTALGLLVCANMSSIGRLLSALTGATGSGMAEVDFITSMPVRVQPVEVLSIVVVAIVLSLAAAAYPAWRSTRVEPVEGLRHE